MSKVDKAPLAVVVMADQAAALDGRGVGGTDRLPIAIHPMERRNQRYLRGAATRLVRGSDSLSPIDWMRSSGRWPVRGSGSGSIKGWASPSNATNVRTYGKRARLSAMSIRSWSLLAGDLGGSVSWGGAYAAPSASNRA